eukprot:CAMPEP_0119284774 /NCGR_PEP_ID=MMETSP1329-20130426/30933_1 /TAXON_ID=114041 /ORGANISM="Genus nov. species nov., Strain RCC1024" /LENGTH=357 /DNA_ID=CAMNT_0007285467 /DNA_START=30 /DNA_END=1103 /DNA_ORIENTATION=-
MAPAANSRDDHGNYAVNIAKHIMSFVITLGSLALIAFGIGGGYAALPGNPIVLYIIFVCVLTLLGYLEGLQVAILALERTSPETFKESYPRGARNLKLATANHGLNVQRFLVGRQFFVVFVVFLIAQITTYAELPFRDDVPDWIYIALIDTGLPGALVVLSFGQLMPQLVAATHPVRVMDLPGSWTVIMITLGFESIGVTHFAWLLTMGVKKGGGCAAKNDLGSPASGAAKVAPDLVVAADETSLERGAALGLAPAAAAGNSKETAAWLMKAAHAREVEGLYARSPAPPGALPSPQDLVRALIEKGEPVPRYLLPPSHPLHIPPHIVAWDLQHRLGVNVIEPETDAAEVSPGGEESA